MTTSVRNFNKIDLKELSRSDVRPVMGRKKMHVMAEIDGMFSKKGTTLMCKPCQIVHLDVKSLMNHIKNSHADLLGYGSRTAKWKARRSLLSCLQRICDPSLQIELVAISSEKERKMFMKKDQSNIYEDAAYLVSKLVSPTTAQHGKK